MDYKVMAPVTLENGSTAWVEIGKGVKGHPGRNKYAARMTITSLPVHASAGKPFDVYLFDRDAEGDDDDQFNR